LAAFGDLKLSDMQRRIPTHISHEHKLNCAILLWDTDHREWVTWVRWRKILVLSIALRLSEYCCHSGLDPVGFRLIWDDWTCRQREHL